MEGGLRAALQPATRCRLARFSLRHSRHPGLFLHSAATRSELTDPEHRIQLHDLLRDEVAEQVLGLKDTHTQRKENAFDFKAACFGQTRHPIVYKELRVKYVAGHTS